MTYLNLIKAANVFGFIEEKMKKEGTIIITIITKNGAQIKNSITKKCKILRSLGGCSYLYIVSGTACATFLKEHYDSINSGGYFLKLFFCPYVYADISGLETSCPYHKRG